MEIGIVLAESWPNPPRLLSSSGSPSNILPSDPTYRMLKKSPSLQTRHVQGPRVAKEQLAISSSTPPGEKETPLSRQHPAHFFFFFNFMFFCVFFFSGPWRTLNSREEKAHLRRTWKMVAVLHPCSHAKKPLLILYWEREKKKKQTHKNHWGRGAGANKPEITVLLCCPVWKRECTITSQEQIKMLSYTGNWNFKQGNLMA